MSAMRIVPIVGAERLSITDQHMIPVVNPATEVIEFVAPRCGAEQVDEAVGAAREAGRRWRRMPTAERCRTMLSWADRVESEGAALGLLDTLSVGRPVRDTQHDAQGVAEFIRYWAGMVDKIRGSELPIAPGHHVYTRRESLGVVAILLPWNGPAAGFAERVAPAIACGNGVVVKPSELAPASAVRLAELALESGVPEGLLNVLTGDGATGEELVRHPGVAGVSFTGSLQTGQKVAAAAANGMKKTVLELGGKSPNVIFDDANLASAVRGAVWGVFFNSGQVCCAGTRLLVQEGVVSDVVDRISAAAKDLRVGDPQDARNHLGPVASEEQLRRIRGYCSLAERQGAKRAGASMAKHLPERGYFAEPTIFVDVEPDSDLAQEEVFGPVLAVIPFSTAEEAVAIGNGVKFGLSANVWTSDLGRASYVSSELEVGSVWVNTKQLAHPAMPFGGYKMSGVGNAGGDQAIEANTQVKVVAMRYEEAAPAPGWDDLPL